LVLCVYKSIQWISMHISVTLKSFQQFEVHRNVSFELNNGTWAVGMHKSSFEDIMTLFDKLGLYCASLLQASESETVYTKAI
jgi:hypothetical protein